MGNNPNRCGILSHELGLFIDMGNNPNRCEKQPEADLRSKYKEYTRQIRCPEISTHKLPDGRWAGGKEGVSQGVRESGSQGVRE
eukprot:761824-Hanusia_phi.AAC.1